MSTPTLRKIGFISKLNGYKGELVIAGSEDDFFDAEFLFMLMDGIAVPFAVETIFEKSGNAIVKFEDVDNEESALRFVKRDIFVEEKKKKSKRRNFSPNDFSDYSIIDSSFGNLGRIIRIDEYPQQQIAVCIVKEKEVLIPLNEDFIDEINDENKQIMVSLPEGLIDVYLS